MKGTVDKLLNFMKLSDDEEYDEEYEEYEDDEEEEEEPRSTFSFFKKKEPEVEEESSNSKISQPFDNYSKQRSKETKIYKYRKQGRIYEWKRRGSLCNKATGFCRSTDGSRSFKRRKNSCDQSGRCRTYSCTEKY